MSTIAELIAAIPVEPTPPIHPWMDYSHYYSDLALRREAQLRVAYEALNNARSALIDAAPMKTVAPDIEELDLALAAIKPPMDIAEGERNGR